MTREEEIRKSCNDLLEGAGIDELEKLKLGLWYKMGAKFADDNPKEGVNWQQVRIQAAIAAMQGIISNEGFLQDIEKLSKDTASVRKRTAIISVEYSDALVKELKGE